MKKIRILGYDYKIDRSKTKKQIGCAGTVETSSQTIRVAKDICFEMQQSTLLHEVLEAMRYHLELPIKHNTVMQLEVAIYGFLKDNGVDISKLLKGK